MTASTADIGQGCTGPNAAQAAQSHGIALVVVKAPRPSGALILSLSKDVLPRRWLVERSLAWPTRRWRRVRDDEGYFTTLTDLDMADFACLMLN